MMFWLLASGRFRVTSQENIFHECLARQKEDRISPLFIQNDATFQKEGGNPPHFKSS
jgi:hypothetical protein